MLAHNTSGQFLYFALTPSFSGLSVTNASGQISGRRAVDTGAMTVLSGNVVEVTAGQGLYRANLFAWDTSGMYIGYLFTSSGCKPVYFSEQTSLAISGDIYPVVPTATLSGVVANSGLNVVAPVVSGTLSGQFVTANVIQVAGTTTFVNDGTLASGTSGTVQFPSTDVAGNTIPDDIRYEYTALQIVGGSGTGEVLLLGTKAPATSGTRMYNILSGTGPVAPNSTSQYVVLGSWRANTALWVGSGPLQLDANSFVQASIGSGQLSGQPIAGLSGFIYPASGIWPASGAFVVATSSPPASGTIYLASGQAVSLNSGQSVLVSSGQLSGQQVNLTSGQSYIASGINTVVPISSISGVSPISGATVTVPLASISGTFATVPVSTLSGVVANSGLNVSADVQRWLTVAPNPLTASGHVDASFATRVGVARSGTSTTIQLDASAPTGASGIYNGQLIYVVAGSGANEVRRIASYDSSGNVTVDRAFVVAPFNNSIFNIIPAQGVQSGNAQIASGPFVTVPIASISGVVVNSGLNVTVPLATLSGVTASLISGTTYLASGSAVSLNSGQSVLVYSGQLSGQQVNLTSGQSYTASGINTTVPPSSISGVSPISGATVVVPPATLSGVTANSGLFVTTVSGQVYPASGVYAANVVQWVGTLVPAPAQTGVPKVDINYLKGFVISTDLNNLQSVNVVDWVGNAVGAPNRVGYPAVDVKYWAGDLPNPLTNSGKVDAAVTNRAGAARSGTSTTVQLDAGAPLGISGIYDGQLISIVAGSGAGEVRRIAFYDSSGNVTVDRPWKVAAFNNSIFNIIPEQDSQSGKVQIASGAFVTVPISTLSGVVVNSGLNVTVPISTISGVTPSLISGTTYLASGSAVCLNSGQSVLVYSGQLSGQPAAAPTITSGQVWLASGSIPIAGSSGVNAVVPVATLSGINIQSGAYPASGINVTVPIASISGVVANSGLFVNATATITSGQVWLASGQAVSLNSGQSVLVYSGQLSGQPIAGLSGFIYPASGIWPASGAFVNATATVTSGQVYLASGSAVSLNSGQSVLVYSGQLSGQPGATPTINSGQIWLASGQAVSLNSGQSVLVYSGQLSGQPIAGLSGLIYPASGVFVTATATITSGQVWLASGQAVALNSGQSTLVYSGQLSGQPIAGLSGFIYPASGIWPASGANSASTITSGQVWLASGQAVALNSGQSVLAYSGQLSGQPIAGLSGFIYHASGTNATVPPATLSGVNAVVPTATISGVIPASGSSVLASVTSISSGLLSGQQVSLVSGQSYTASGIWPASGTNSASTITSGQVWLASGQAVSLNSGQSVLVYSGQLSGQPAATPTITSGAIYLASGSSVALNSGQQTLPYSGQMSGQQVQVLTNLDKAGYSLANASVTSGTFASGLLSQVVPQFILQSDFSGQTAPKHSLLNASRKLINRWDTTTSSGLLTVFLEDDAGVAYTQAIGSQSGATPVVSLRTN